MNPQAPSPVKLFIAVLFHSEASLEMAFALTVEYFGANDYQSPRFDFTASDYYRPEMGWPLYRQFFSFQKLLDPGELPAVKLRTNDIETKFAVDGTRRVNLDPGYMDFNKVVLASTKFNGQKIYLHDGIYADPTLVYEKGVFQPTPFAFPDFKDGQYSEVFMQIRSLYKAQVKQLD